MTLNTTRSKVLHICVAIVPGFLISVRFAVRPAVFKTLQIFLSFTIDYHVKQPKENKKNQQFKISHCTVLLTLVETLPRSMDFVYFQGRCHLQLLLPYSLMFTKMAKIQDSNNFGTPPPFRGERMIFWGVSVLSQVTPILIPF